MEVQQSHPLCFCQSLLRPRTNRRWNFDETLRHESYPFARIASEYDLSAEIMFAYQMGVLDDLQYKGQTVTMETFESDTPKFRIAFFIQNDPEGKPSICLQYDNGRYSKELMQSLAQSISNAANTFMSNPDAKLNSISLLDDKQTALLDSFTISCSSCFLLFFILNLLSTKFKAS